MPCAASADERCGYFSRISRTGVLGSRKGEDMLGSAPESSLGAVAPYFDDERGHRQKDQPERDEEPFSAIVALGELLVRRLVRRLRDLEARVGVLAHGGDPEEMHVPA